MWSFPQHTTYITSFLLPKLYQLSFASSAHKYRLLSKMLHVLLVILRRYVILPKEVLEPLSPINFETLQKIQFYFYKTLTENPDFRLSLYPSQLKGEDLDKMQVYIHDFKDDVIPVPSQ